MGKKRTLDITPSPRLLQVLGDIPLAPWQCLAELVDNSLDELLKQPERAPDDPLVVDISVEEDAAGRAYLIVEDNGFGMTSDELERSLRAGHSAKNRYGSLGLFGMGFNIATARLGGVTRVSTTQAGSDECLEATIDFADIQRRESFSVPVERSDADADQSGTVVRVLLKREMAANFKRPANQKTLRAQLGDVYSFLLRDSVPGVSREGMSAKIPAELRLGGKEVVPRLPCVWNDSRAVTSYGQEVHAVQYVDRKLTEATACLDCGYWDRKNGPEFCEECGSSNLDLRQRRIWGWLGIQRYIDSSNYGIDFIRYGRKILKLDKSVFSFTDPDTLQTDVEYPIEMPANQGRIVGEIHLDHVPVTYQKNDFDRQSFDWQKALEVLRGKGPLKPKGARAVNDSPLALLYSAYRRNDPGLRYLTPGDGKRAIHSKAREWAQLFEKGIARVKEDTEWYEAAERHQMTKDGPSKGTVAGGTTPAGGTNSVVETLLGTGSGASAPEPDVPQLSQAERLEAARKLGVTRSDLSGTFNLGSELGSWDITVVSTRDSLQDPSGRVAPAIPGSVRGTAIEILVSSEHLIFREYGRDIRDVALVQAAALIRELKSSVLSQASVYAGLVEQVADLRVTTPSILDRIDRTLDRIRQLAFPVVSEDPHAFWGTLDANEKHGVENRAAAELPTVALQDLVEDGRFVQFCGAESLSKIVEKKALLLFEGVVFLPSLVHRAPAAQDRIVGTVTRALQSVYAFQQDELLRQKHDVQMVQISLDLLDEQLTDEGLLL
jgi:hypothetical protein